MGAMKRWWENKKRERRDRRAVEDWVDEMVARDKAERRRQGRAPRGLRAWQVKMVLGVMLGFVVLRADSCVITRYDVFGNPAESQVSRFDHVDDNCGEPSTWDRVQALVNAGYNHCYKVYWWRVSRYEIDPYQGRVTLREQWWEYRECGAMTYTWRDDGRACTTNAGGSVRG